MANLNQEKLLSTLIDEEKVIDKKPIGIIDKFNKADQILANKPQNTNNAEDNIINKTELKKAKSQSKRKTFYFSEADLELLDKFAEKLWDLRVDINDSELLRVALANLNNLSDTALIEECNKLVKIGRKRSRG